MLRALLRNKLGRILSDEAAPGEGEDVRDAVRRAEDALTATLFERLLYLPPARAEALVQPEEGEVRGSWTEYPTAHFWPSHRLADRRVEPDVVLEFPDRVVIVEVKWGTPHYADQWKRELLAAAERYPGDRELHLLLLGRADQHPEVRGLLHPFVAEMRQATGRVVKVGWLSWERLFQALVTALDTEMPLWERAVLTDLRDVLADRGLRSLVFLETLKSARIGTTAGELLDRWAPGAADRRREEAPAAPESYPQPTFTTWKP